MSGIPSPYTLQLQSSDLLGFRLRKLTREVADKISVRTRMFDVQRTSEDFTDAMTYFPSFLATYFAIAWSIYIANAIPSEDARVYSSRYLDLDVDQDGFLTVLAGRVIEQSLLPDYRLGFLVALVSACHMTKQTSAQKRLWTEFNSHLSNLFASSCLYTELGIGIFQNFTDAESVSIAD